MADIPPGIIGGLGGTDPNSTALYLMFSSWTTVKFGEGSPFLTSGDAKGCAFPGVPYNYYPNGSPPDFSWIPTTDVYGSNLINASYNAVTNISGGHIGTISMANIRAAAYNATDDMATRARTNGNVPMTVFAVGFTNAVDDTLLQRISNDPDWISNSSCASSGKCVFHADQPQGTYVFAATTADLIPAFLTLSSQILRLSR